MSMINKLGLATALSLMAVVMLTGCTNSGERQETSGSAEAASLPQHVTPLSLAAMTAAADAPEVQLGRAAMQDAKRDAEALAAFQAGADKGNPVAETYLGYLYFMGHSVHQNDQRAADWYRRAAEQGFVDAQLRLGLIYAAGRDLYDPAKSVPKDEAQAKYWLGEAAAQGSHIAADKIGELMLIGSLPGLGDDSITSARNYLQPAGDAGDKWAQGLLCLSYKMASDNPAEQRRWCDLEQRNTTPTENGTLGDTVLESPVIPMPVVL